MSYRSEIIPGVPTDDSDLPDGVTREQYCTQGTNLDNCHALRITIEQTYQVMVWRDRGQPKITCESKPRVRDLRPGDEVKFEGRRWTVKAVEIFR